MDYKKVAVEILDHVGGADNVKSFTHCATRLRFNLKDENLYKADALKITKGVMGSVVSGGQHQVIIGTDVSHVYEELVTILGSDVAAKGLDIVEKDDIAKSKFSLVLDTISGIFTPILPAIVGGAMVKTLLIIFTLIGIMDKSGQTYQILTFVGDTPFYFLPIMLSYSAAQKFKMNPMMGMLLGLMMIHPTYMTMIETGDPVRLFGLVPLTLAKYTSTVIPVILVVWVASYVERFADRITPKAVRFFLKPLITLLIMVPIAFCVVGPLGTIAGNGLQYVLNVIQTQAPWALPIIFGVAAPIVIMLGMHYVVTIPLVMSAIAASGFDMLGAGFLVANIAQSAAAFAVMLQSKDTDFKAMAGSTGLTALLGVSEPAMYGVNLKLKKPFIGALCGGFAGGIVCGIAGVKRVTFGPTGLTTIAIFIDPQNNMNFIMAIVGVVVSFTISFLITYILIKKDSKIQKEIGA